MAVGDGHLLYVEECAAVDGLPVLFLHGGPGSGCSPAQRRLFDPKRYRAIFVDQRGAGRSRPRGERAANTTADLVMDLEYVREALGIRAWIVFGGSWGSLLALTYAQLFPERVLGLVLRGIFLGSPEEIEAYVQGTNGGASEAWQKFAAAMPVAERDGLLVAYARRILGNEPQAALVAATAWLVFGGSWGSLLALTYAQLFPERVLGLVLRGIFLGSPEEIQAYVQGTNGGASEAWQKFAAAMPVAERDGLLVAYARRILGNEPQAALSAATAWLDYERALMGEPPLTAVPDAGQLAKVQVQMHYLTHHCFVANGQLLAGVDRLRHIPAAIVQDMADPVCPPGSAEKLHRAWPEATWFPVAGAGHAALSPPIARACIKALGGVGECAEA